MGILLVSASYFSFTGPYLIVIACGIISVTLGLTAPNSIHEAMRTLPNVVGSATGMMRCLQMAGGGVATLIVSRLADGKPELSVWALNVTMLGWIIISVIGYILWRVTCWHENKNAQNGDGGKAPAESA